MALKIRQYCVTYNNPKILNEWYLKSLYDSLSAEELTWMELFVINNHTNFRINEKFSKRGVRVIHNRLRPDFSTGHLSRNWNQALINGFESLQTPAVDIVILTQDDTKFRPNYLKKLVDIHKKNITFYSCGVGDQFHSYRVGAVRTVGLWDERFCGIGYQEADYFMRQILWNPAAASINDPAIGHGRVYNPIDGDLIQVTETGKDRGELYHKESSAYHKYGEKMWRWKYNYPPGDWDVEYVVKHKDEIYRNSPSFFLYPYFEKDMYSRKEQGFVLPEEEFGDVKLVPQLKLTDFNTE